MLSTHCFCRILTKLESSRQSLEEHSNIKVHANLSSGSRVVQCGWTDGRTGMTKLIVVFRNFANVPTYTYTFSRENICMSFVRIPQQMIIYLYIINVLVVITEAKRVYCAVRTVSLNIRVIQVKFH